MKFNLHLLYLVAITRIDMVRISFFSFLMLIIACSSSPVEKIKKHTIKAAEEYARGNLDNSKKEISGNGIISIGDSVKKYMIDPSVILTGLIDDDNQTDALITIISFSGGKLDLIEHLIMIRINNKITVQRSVESDMKILGLKDRIITAEVPTHPRTSPLFNCPECREVVKYRYVAGELVKVD